MLNNTSPPAIQSLVTDSRIALYQGGRIVHAPAGGLGSLAAITPGAAGLAILADAAEADVISYLNVKALNASDGFTFTGEEGPIEGNSTITGTATTGLYETNVGHFGGLFASARARTVFNTVTDTGLAAETGPRFAVAISHESEGNTGSLAGNTHCGLWVFAGKTDWLTNDSLGDHSATYFMNQVGLKGNGAALNMATYKVFTGVDTDDNGGAMNFEGSAVNVDETGAVVRQVQIYGGYQYDAGTASNAHVYHDSYLGFVAEAQVADGYTCFGAVSRAGSAGTPGWARVLNAITDRTGTEYFHITGDKHADGGGRIRASLGTAALPTYSAIGDTNTGVYFPAADQVGLAAGGGVRIWTTTTQVHTTVPMKLVAGTAIPAGGTAAVGYTFSSTANFGIFFGSGAPTLSAAKGSLYLRSDGSGTGDRAYINTNGGTTWTALTTAA